MLHDPKNDYHPLDNFIAWLEIKPAAGTYDWEHCGHCLFAQYGDETQRDTPNYKGVHAGLKAGIIGAGLTESTRKYFLIGAGGYQHGPWERQLWTYGQALSRARKVREEIRNSVAVSAG